MERERREIERRRQEDEERQRLLDQEIRMLARYFPITNHQSNQRCVFN